MMLPTLSTEAAISLALQQLASMIEAQPDPATRDHLLAARKQIGIRLDAVRWNRFAATVTAASRRRVFAHRHKGRHS